MRSRSLRIPSILMPLLVVLGSLPGMAQEAGFGMGLGVHLGTLLGGDGVQQGNTANDRIGSGVEGILLYRWSPATETRALVAFTGIRSGSWQDDSDGSEGGEYWRSLRFGVEQSLDLPVERGGHPYLLFGGGIQESWVARTNGNLAGATLAAIWNAWTNTHVDYHYSKYSDSLDTWGGYGTAGLGWRFEGPGYLELRAVVADRQEFKRSGLTTLASEPKVFRRGVQCFLSFGLRGR